MAAVGILGGTFDPVHFGHLALAQEVAEDLELEQVRLIPAGVPPHRELPGAGARLRLEMVQLATANNPLLLCDGREAEKSTPCYTVETLLALRRELGNEIQLFLILGADAFLGLPLWHRWRDIFSLAHVVVATRPGFTLADNCSAELADELARRAAESMPRTPSGSIMTTEITPLAISATAIRQKLARKKSARYLLPDAVLDYIRSNHLYQEQDEHR